MFSMHDCGNGASVRELHDSRRRATSQAAQPSGPTPRDWLYVLGQMGLVAAIELVNDALHAANPQANALAGQADALRVMDFERAHGFWVKPRLQQFFASRHQLLGHILGWNQLRPFFDAMYGQGHVLFTLAFAFWVYFRRRSLFPFIRNVFVLTGLLAVASYEAFPLAPPRLAQGLRYEGHPYHFLDAVFGSGGVKLSFNEYAAMPSVHVAWALIVGLTLWRTARPWVVRALGLLYPFLMLTTVIVTGNHYLSDGLGALAAVCLAGFLSALIARCGHTESLPGTLRRLQALGYQRPGAADAVAMPVKVGEERRTAA